MASNVTTLTMSEMIEETLDQLYRPTERPRQVVLSAAVASNDTTIEVSAESAARIASTDVIELGSELVLVSGVSGQDLTVSRGYAGTTAAAYASGVTGTVNTLYPRYQVDREIRRCFQSLQSALPLIATEYVYPVSTSNPKALLPLDENTMRVLDVRWANPQTGDVRPLKGRWEFIDWLPDEVAYTNKGLAVPAGYWNQPLIVTTQIPYTWSGTGESATIDITIGGEALPVEYAMAKLATGREVSRQEFDQIEEWNQVMASRQGQNIRLLQALWGRYYQRLDEVRNIQNTPKMMTYKRAHHRL